MILFSIAVFGCVACNNKGYGEKCSTPCGNCLGLAQCHHLNGTCMDGCDPGYKDSACNVGRNVVIEIYLYLTSICNP